MATGTSEPPADLGDLLLDVLSGQVPPTESAPVLDLVVPVHNEQRPLAVCIRTLHGYLSRSFPYPFRITIADNASSDATAHIGQCLAAAYREVRLVSLPDKGRGRALHAVWSRSDALVLAYMDVDLSTDLAALAPLVAPLVSGHSDLAIGTRLARGARVVRGTKRETISRCYNLLLHVALATRFSDAQCGFKAIRSDVAQTLLPFVSDTEWFFDTELLVLAERAGLRIAEVPVDWVDDPDSRVDLLPTAIADLKGVVRVAWGLALGRLPVGWLRRQLGRAPLPDLGPPGTRDPESGRVGRPTATRLVLPALLIATGIPQLREQLLRGRTSSLI